jgi:glycosyltransferase involved in cell wall biosynthesis
MLCSSENPHPPGNSLVSPKRLIADGLSFPRIKMPAPLLSVTLANYNHGHFLPKCFAGLLAQTFTNFEIVITDDGSTDGSQDLIREYAARDPRIRPHFFPENRGIAAATANLFGRTTGKYLYSGAADDFVINKDFFLHAVTALEHDPRPAGFYGITGIYLSEKEKLVESCGTAEVEGYNTPLQCAQGFIKCRSVVTSPSCIWRSDLLLKYWAQDNERLFKLMGPQVDFYVCHALAFTYGMHYQKNPYACQRIFEAKTNYSANLHLWETASRYAELEKGLRATGITYPEIEADWMRWRAYWMIDVIKKSGVKL